MLARFFGVGLLSTSCACAGSASPAAEGNDPTAASAPQARLADLAQFRRDLLARDRAFAPAARSAAETRLARLEADAARVSQAFFELELARIVALADNGHTMTLPGPRSRRYNRVPIRLAPFGREFHVVRFRTEHGELAGARLTGIDGRSIDELRGLARALTGGTEAWRDRNAGQFFESPAQLHALGAADQEGSASYRFVLPGGETTERRLVAEPPGPDRPGGGPERWLYPEPLESEGAAWLSALAIDHAPWSLREPRVRFRRRVAPEVDGLVVELRQTHDAEGQPIGPFLSAVTDEIRGRRPQNLVLDMRWNGGGDLTTARTFVQSLPKLVPGKIFGLISPYTFSAAISSLGYLEQAAPERVILVGEAVGDRLQFWAEGQPVTLRHSGVVLLPATERHDYLTGCKPFDDCHGNVVRHPIAVPSLEPDIAAPWTFDAWSAGRDPALEAVQASLDGAPQR